MNANVNVGIKVLKESSAVELDEAGKPVEIMIKELLAEFGGRSALASYKREAMSYCRRLCAALIVDKKGSPLCIMMIGD